jgi:hypothetical protein
MDGGWRTDFIRLARKPALPQPECGANRWPVADFRHFIDKIGTFPNETLLILPERNGQ